VPIAKNKELWMAYMDIGKAFDRVPREVVVGDERAIGVDNG